ncbi:MAG: MerR family transcriptional regulator, partial [Treponemataceae bacterium]|nr:MerR family transcriptional regulator [Treponemataceae bacterium]
VYDKHFLKEERMTTGEVARRTRFSESALRYYERRGLIEVRRAGNGRREWTGKDAAWIAFICRLKDTGMKIKDIRRYAALRAKGDSTLKVRLAVLEQHRKYVLEQQKLWNKNLASLEDKIRLYREKIAGTNQF